MSGNQRPDFLTCLAHVSLALHLPRQLHLCRSSSKVPHLPSFLKLPQSPHAWLTFDKVQSPLRLPHKTTLEVQNWSEHAVLYHFDLEMCFAPQRHRLFRYLNFQKLVRTCGACGTLTSKRASRTAACTFSTSELPKALRP